MQGKHRGQAGGPGVGGIARRPARHQGVQGGGKGVDVRRDCRPGRLEAFRRSVLGSQRFAAHRLLAAGRDDRGKPEIRQTDDAVRVDQDVSRLNVPVQDPGRVRRSESVSQVGADPAGQLRTHRPAAPQLIPERAGRAQFHHQVRPPVTQRSRVIDVDDVRMPGQPPGRGHLADEAPLVTLGLQDPPVNLHRRLTADRYLPRSVHRGEATRAEHTADSVSRNVRCLNHTQTA
jgi:hypothetical protein